MNNRLTDNPSGLFGKKHAEKTFSTVNLHRNCCGLFLAINIILCVTVTSNILAADHIASIVIEDADANPVTGTIKLQHPLDTIALFSAGYDSLKNRIGLVKCNWSANSILHPIEAADSTTGIIYRSAIISSDEFGNISAVSIDNQFAFDMVHMEITGPAAGLWQALSLDENGNGLLDAIDARFTRPINLFVDTVLGASIEIKYRHPNTVIALMVSDIEIEDSNTTAIVHFFEDTAALPGILQSNWKPEISFRNNPEIHQDSAIECMDGAGPVISGVMSVTNKDSTQNRITVTFSENIRGYEGNNLQPTSRPFILFHVCQINTNDTLYMDSMLSDIDTFAEVDSNRVVFYMGKGQTLNNSHYLKIKTTPRAPIRDAAGSPIFGPGNSPSSLNRMVRVKVTDSDTSGQTDTGSESTSNCGCGSSAGLAFLPPFAIKAGRLFRRRKNSAGVM
jgi:hypothetical protein